VKIEDGAIILLEYGLVASSMLTYEKLSLPTLVFSVCGPIVASLSSQHTLQ